MFYYPTPTHFISITPVTITTLINFIFITVSFLPKFTFIKTNYSISEVHLFEYPFL